MFAISHNLLPCRQHIPGPSQHLTPCSSAAAAARGQSILVSSLLLPPLRQDGRVLFGWGSLCPLAIPELLWDPEWGHWSTSDQVHLKIWALLSAWRDSSHMKQMQYHFPNIYIGWFQVNQTLSAKCKTLTRTYEDNEQAATPLASLLGISTPHTAWDVLGKSHQPPPVLLLHLPLPTPPCHKLCLTLLFCHHTKPCSAVSANSGEDEESPAVDSLPTRDPRTGHLPVPVGSSLLSQPCTSPFLHANPSIF